MVSVDESNTIMAGVLDYMCGGPFFPFCEEVKRIMREDCKDNYILSVDE